MKKLLILALILVGGVATADSSITSKQYVDTVLDTLQSQIPAKNTDTVLTNTGTAGEIGEKKIYNTNNSYDEQTDALVTAGAFNSAVQNALESEFVCTEWQGDVHDNAHCLLYEVRVATQRQILPDGYTQLEYLESTDTQYIDTRIIPNQDYSMELDYQPTVLQSMCFAGTRYKDAHNEAFTINSGNANSLYYIAFGDSGNQTVARMDTGRHKTRISKTGWGFDGVKTMRTFNDFQARSSIFLFANHDSSTNTASHMSRVRIYNAKIWNHDNLVRNFIPARRNSDGELGMYDLVSGNFFTNSGTGEFVAGPVGDSNLYLPSGN